MKTSLAPTLETGAPPANGGPRDDSHPGMVDLLARHPFTKGMPRRVVERLADFATEAGFAAGDTIFREGDPANRFYLIVEGRVAIESFMEERGMVPVHTLGAGDVLGWSWLFPPYYWHFDARAVEPTRAIFLYGTPLRELCEEDAQLGCELYKRIAATVVARLQATRERLLRLDSPAAQLGESPRRN
jgi:CRP/FNR family cyclic AMP-dependent transcriptional regulator